jgi:ferric-dicitrate binding protein FerR (iron transport regulator)
MSGGFMEKYNEILKNWQAPDGLSTEDALQKIEGRLAATELQSPGKGRLRTMWLAAAGVAAAIAITWMVLLPNNRVIRQVTETAATKSVTLPDGSMATMNLVSSLTYSEDWSDNRVVELNGEAFFEVKKGSRFEVKTPMGLVTVLGTSFNVFSRDNDMHVACVTGKVSVQQGQEQVVITPGQKVESVEGHLKVSDFNTAQKSWRDGVFYFDNVALAAIVKEMERQFQIQVVCDEEINQMIGMTTNFSKENMEMAFQTVGTPAGLEFVPMGDRSYRLQKQTLKR